MCCATCRSPCWWCSAWSCSCPALADRMEAPLSRLARFGPRSTRRRLPLGLLVGGALGFVYTPCASPILAAVITVSALGQTILLALAYAAGSGAVLFAAGVRRPQASSTACAGPAGARSAAGARRGDDRHRGRDRDNLDVKFDQFVAEEIPDVNLTAGLECSNTVTSRLHEITGHRPEFAPANGSDACGGSASNGHTPAPTPARRRCSRTRAPPEKPRRRAGIHRNPALVQHPRRPPLTLASLRGRVVLVDFWTYTCINCIRTLPYLKAWDAAYRKDGLTIVGVETPEFPFEHEACNVKTRSSSSACTTPSSRTTTWAPGTPTATRTGPPTT